MSRRAFELRRLLGCPAAGTTGRTAFTLIELLVVVAIVTVLAALLLPAFGLTKGKSKTVSCLSQLKQFATATQMYSGDNNGFLVANSTTTGTNGWVGGNLKVEAQATNTALLRQAKLFPYSGRTEMFHCPADVSTGPTGGLRARSYAMNSWIGSRVMETVYTSGMRNFRTFVREAELAAGDAATLWLMADEHEATIDDGVFLVTMDDSRPFANFPALRHQHGFALNFVDGHAELWKLRDPTTKLERQTAQVSSKNSDWLRLKQETTIPQ